MLSDCLETAVVFSQCFSYVFGCQGEGEMAMAEENWSNVFLLLQGKLLGVWGQREGEGATEGARIGPLQVLYKQQIISRVLATCSYLLERCTDHHIFGKLILPSTKMQH